MRAIEAKTKKGNTVFRPELSASEFTELSEEYAGFCIACGEITESGCEPDARGYECDSCGESKVYGLEELMLMGYVLLTDD